MDYSFLLHCVLIECILLVIVVMVYYMIPYECCEHSESCNCGKNTKRDYTPVCLLGTYIVCKAGMGMSHYYYHLKKETTS